MNSIHFFVVILVAIAIRNPTMSGAQPIANGKSNEGNTFQRVLSRNVERIERVLRSQYDDEDVKMRVIPTSGYDAATGMLSFTLGDDLGGEERTSITSAQLWVEAKNEEIIRSLLGENRQDQAAYVLKRHGSDDDDEEETDYDDDMIIRHQNSSSPTLLMIKIEEALKEKREDDKTPLDIDLTAGLEIVSACIAVFWTATPTLNMLVDETFLGQKWEQVVDYEGKRGQRKKRK